MVYQVKNFVELQGQLKKSGPKLVVINFFLPWYGPCIVMDPVIEKHSRQFPHVTFLKVDLDQAQEIAAQYEVGSRPTFVFIKNMYTVDTVNGLDMPKLEAALQKHAGRSYSFAQ